jgi:hypothetical protein
MFAFLRFDEPFGVYVYAFFNSLGFVVLRLLFYFNNALLRLQRKVSKGVNNLDNFVFDMNF